MHIIVHSLLSLFVGVPFSPEMGGGDPPPLTISTPFHLKKFKNGVFLVRKMSSKKGQDAHGGVVFGGLGGGPFWGSPG